MIDLHTAIATDPGLARSHNEDAVYAFQHGQMTLLIVADGMGGHQAGEVASALAVETIRTHLLPLLKNTPATAPDLATALRTAVDNANRAIVEYGVQHEDEAEDLGTTLTAALIHGANGVVANVGDSRTYLLRDAQLTQITHDHSYVGELVRVGILQPHEVFDHPRRSVILRSLGSDLDTDIDLFPITLEVNDQLLLCSDGLWEMVRDSTEIKTILNDAPTPQRAAEQLIQRANHYGGEDNIGVALAKVTERI